MFRFVYLLLLTGILCGYQVEMIPTNADMTETLFESNIWVWDTLKQRLEDRGVSVRSTGLNDVPKKLRWYHKRIPWCMPKRDVDKIVTFNLPYYMHHQKIFNLPKEKLILFLMEPPTIAPDQYNPRAARKFSKIYTYDDDLVDGKLYHKFYYPCMHPMIDDFVPFSKRGFACMVNANKSCDHPDQTYTLREEAILYFENQHPDKFDLYGWGWEPKGFKTYRGGVDDKIITIAQYKFSICYENTCSMNGYVTEKIFDSFRSGTIPVYLGAPNIEKFVPKNCFIDKRDFPSYDALFSHLESISEATFNQYIENIRIFLESDEAHLFTEDHFINTVVDAVTNP